MTKTIVVLNQKGGPGKSTICMHIAGTLGRRGHDVLVVDADPQGTSQRWAASAPEAEPFPATIAGLEKTGGTIHRQIQKFIGRFDFIVIDCPPAVESPIPQSAALIADLAIIPIIPSPPDIWAAMPISKLIENSQGVNESLRALLLLNQYDDRRTLAKDTRKLLEEFSIPLAKQQIGFRESFRHAPMYGTTVHTLGAEAKKATEEIDQLTDEILEILFEKETAVNA